MQIDVQLILGVLRRFDPTVIYLFGSFAAGRARADSDVDVAFLPATEADPYAVFEAAQELAGYMGRDVDLVDLSRASAVMRAQVIHRGERLAVADGHRVAEFEMYALSDYARLNEERRKVVAKVGDPARA